VYPLKVYLNHIKLVFIKYIYRTKSLSPDFYVSQDTFGSSDSLTSYRHGINAYIAEKSQEACSALARGFYKLVSYLIFTV